MSPGVMFTPEGVDFQIAKLRLDLGTGELSMDPRQRLELWYHWARLAILHMQDAGRTRGAMVGSMSSNHVPGVKVALMRETMSVMQCMTCAAFSIESFSLAVQEHLPPNRHPNGESTAARIMERLAGGFRIGNQSRLLLKKPLRNLFEARNRVVHPPYEFESVGPHPVAKYLVDWHQRNFHLDNARQSVAMLRSLYRDLPRLARQDVAGLPDLVGKMRRLSHRLDAIGRGRLIW